jgi:carbamate kinase
MTEIGSRQLRGVEAVIDKDLAAAIGQLADAQALLSQQAGTIIADPDGQTTPAWPANGPDHAATARDRLGS